MESKMRPAIASGIQYSHDLVTHHDQLSAVSEAFKIARTNIEFSSIDSRIRSLMVTSSTQTEGKTVTLSNLAITYAQMGRKVLLVDADLRRPAVHRYFGYANRRGLTNVLIGAGHFSEYILPTLTENLSILPAGPIPPNPADLLMSQTFADLIDELEKEFDLILIDCPPVGAVTDAAIVSTKVDATIFVVRAGQTNKNMLKRATALLEQVNARVLGFVMNGVSEESDDYYYYYYQYYYQADPASEAGEGKRLATAPRKKRRHEKAAPAQSNRGFHAAPLVRQSNVPVGTPPLMINNQPLPGQHSQPMQTVHPVQPVQPGQTNQPVQTVQAIHPVQPGQTAPFSQPGSRPLRSLAADPRTEIRPEARTGGRPDAGGTLISDDD